MASAYILWIFPMREANYCTSRNSAVVSCDQYGHGGDTRKELNTGCAVILRLSILAHVCGNVRPSDNSVWLDAISRVTSFLK